MAFVVVAVVVVTVVVAVVVIALAVVAAIKRIFCCRSDDAKPSLWPVFKYTGHGPNLVNGQIFGC